MLSGEVVEAGERLASLGVIRTEAIDAWVSLALEQPDPIEWANSLAAAALDKLALVPQSLAVKAEARLQIVDIRRAILVGIANCRSRAPELKTSA